MVLTFRHSDSSPPTDGAVELTALFLRQTEDIEQAGRVTQGIVERGLDHVYRHVVQNLRPEGAFDPYLRALGATLLAPAREAEAEPITTAAVRHS